MTEQIVHPPLAAAPVILDLPQVPQEPGHRYQLTSRRSIHGHPEEDRERLPVHHGFRGVTTHHGARGFVRHAIDANERVVG